MTRTLTGSLRETPAVVPALAAIVLFVVWATSQAAYPLTHWAPGALIVLGLLAIALLGVPLRFAEIPLAVKLALACLVAYTALSFLSILWAAAPGDAWEGANRTLFYLMVFALFSLWRGRSTSAALLLCLWTLALVGVALYVALRLDSATGKSFAALFIEERLSYPAGYPNAAAAQWLMAFWPALLLARSPSLPWALRGLLAGGAVVLADVALLSQSRGSLYSTVLAVVLVFALLPGRLRTFATAAPIVLGVAATAPFLLRVGAQIKAGNSPYAATHQAVIALLAAALLVGVLVAGAAAVESRRSVSPTHARSLRRALGALALATLVVVIAGGLVAGGNPLTRVRHGWESFEGGYSSTAPTGNRLLSGLGSNRYDFYRVALDEFLAHPLLGIGADNFRQQYLMRGRSGETPHYPHSVELRTLSETGLLGALLAVVGLVAGLFAAWHAIRRAEPLARAIAAAALGGFGYWVIHGSFDWFFEFAGLGASAFALLGIACSLQPRALPAVAHAIPLPATRLAAARAPATKAVGSTRAWARPPVRMWPICGLGVVVALLAILSLSAPWLSERQLESAARIWPRAPLGAYARLEDAAELDPLSDRAYLVAGSIALRFGDFSRAEHDFSLALVRLPDDAYAEFELGAVASEQGRRTRALALLARAEVLNPRDPLTMEALQTVRSGRRLSVQALNHSILLRARRLG